MKVEKRPKNSRDEVTKKTPMKRELKNKIPLSN